MVLTRSAEDREVLTAAAAIKRRENREKRLARKEAARDHIRAIVASQAPGKRQPREVDAGFMSWLHQDVPCIACLIEGPGPAEARHIEAAHQKLAIASKGWSIGGLGPRVSDARCVALCAWHHRLAPNSCDTGGQRKFWDRLGIGDGVADLCRSLHSAFLAGQDGAPIVRRFAEGR
ncbi:hypothetical protein [Caulobacter hibisci]|uniref:Uncharacterized protein n=1 Tax=Caulobacter hibisci TaxID=2035993 RepID=A0ABS0STP4_9CAUL|nr:hypothetical protein [Caulobacter hibisci]MBI1682335.1 hypothetical protein [Caulobacter hibisci]